MPRVWKLFFALLAVTEVAIAAPLLLYGLQPDRGPARVGLGPALDRLGDSLVVAVLAALVGVPAVLGALGALVSRRRARARKLRGQAVEAGRLDRVVGALLSASAAALLLLIAAVVWTSYAAYAHPMGGAVAVGVLARSDKADKVSVYASGGAEVPPGARVAVSESAAEGFVLAVESVPDGAEVLLDGALRGTTPASMNPDCTPGTPLRLELRLAGHAPVRHALPCAKDRMVVLKARLPVARGR